MTRINTFQDLQVWQKAHQLVLAVYKVTKEFPYEERFILSAQQKRAAISIASNIVEGFRRRTTKDSLHFYNMSQGSLEELKYQLLLSKDLRFITEAEFKRVSDLSDEVGKLLFRWIESNKQLIWSLIS